MTTSRDVLVGLDLGTSSLKGAALAADGEILARGRAAYPTARDEPGQAEQDPAQWLRAMAEVICQLSASAPPSRWCVVGLTGMIPTLVVVDGDDEPVMPAVTWEDARAEAEGREFREGTGAALGDRAGGLYRRTGQWVDGRYLLPMWMRSRAAEISRTADVTRLLSAKDYLFLRLTGVAATDPSTATGFGGYDLESGAWLPEAVAAAGLEDARQTLPAILPCTSVRPLTAAAARTLGLPADLPVCLGASDSVLGALALGATTPGEVAYVTGSSTVIMGVASESRPDPSHRYLITPLAGEDWGFEMDLLSTGSAVRWLAGLLGLGAEGAAEVLELAALVEPGASGVHVLPFLSGGEQGALWDPALRGTVVGLGLDSGPAELARGLVDAVALESRRCLDVLATAGVPAAVIRAAGPGVSSAFFRQQLADASGREVLYAPEARPLSALGAAVLAARSVGAAVAPDAWTAHAERTTPTASAAPEWDERWARHEALVTRLQTLYAEVAADGG